MFNLVIFGAPGSGKGTQSKKITEKYGLIHLSTGDLLRAEKRSGSPLGKQIKVLIDEGNLVPDKIIQEMVKKFVDNNKNAKGFIFDGFPRNSAQAIWLDQILKEIDTEISMMLLLDVSEEELKKRILQRGKESGRADDADEKIIENRIKVYNKQTTPVMDYYKEKDKYNVVNGKGELEVVFQNICTALQIIA